MTGVIMAVKTDEQPDPVTEVRRSNVRSVSNVYLRDVNFGFHRDECFRVHVRGYAAIKEMLRRWYYGQVDSGGVRDLIQPSLNSGILTPEQAAELTGLRCHCGRRDFYFEVTDKGKHRRVYIPCRCRLPLDSADGEDGQ
jgi:hypothetical protein